MKVAIAVAKERQNKMKIIICLCGLLSTFLFIIFLSTLPPRGVDSFREQATQNLFQSLKDTTLTYKLYKTEQKKTAYYLLVRPSPSELASGPPVYVYTMFGTLVDSTYDMGDDSRFQTRWGNATGDWDKILESEINGILKKRKNDDI